MVAAGILTSRLAGFVRERAAAHFFGVGAFADVYQAAFRGPNLLQNLLGEGTVSAAFIPIYSRMLEEGRERDAGRFAGAVFGLLVAAAAAVALAGVVLAAPIVAVLTPGFVGDAARVAAGELPVDRFALAVSAVRIIFPMTGVLVLSAWALGVLNSHRRFFLPYFAPVVWNAAVIAALLGAADRWFGGPFTRPEGAEATAGLERLVIAACAGALAGGVLQFAVQLPLVLREMRGLRPSLSTRVPGVRQALRAFGPVVAGRGVYQISAYLDVFFASWLAAGALGALRYAQMLYVLPVSLFGLSVAASELPELARLGPEERPRFFARLERSLAQAMFLTLPTAAGYLAFGLLVVGAIFRTGSFGALDGWLVYLLLCGYTLGLPATTAARLFQNAFYALGDTRTPARIAVARVVAGAAVAVPAMIALDRVAVAPLVGEPGGGGALFLGGAGLALGSAVGGWLEAGALLAALRRRGEAFAPPWRSLAAIAGLAAAALGPAAALWWLLGRQVPGWHPALVAVPVVGLYAALYLGAAAALGRPEIAAWTGRLRRRRPPG
jgi:putative peptidoglycan lipid II flippase